MLPMEGYARMGVVSCLGWEHTTVMEPNAPPPQPQQQQPYQSPQYYAQSVPQQIAEPAVHPEVDAGLKYVIPVGRTGLSLAAGYLGLFAILVIPAPLALVLGLLALRELKAKPNKLGRGRAWFGTIMGGLGTLLLLFLIVNPGGA